MSDDRKPCQNWEESDCYDKRCDGNSEKNRIKDRVKSDKGHNGKKDDEGENGGGESVPDSGRRYGQDHMERQRIRRLTAKSRERRQSGTKSQERKESAIGEPGRNPEQNPEQNQPIRKKQQDWTDALREAFEAPMPLRKKAFLRSVRPRQITSRQFILQQASYIRKWVWALSFGVFLTALAGGRILDRDILWLLSAMMPFLAVSSVTEYLRAEVHGMAELEMAARFCLKSVLLARMGMLGIVHFGTLCLVSLCGYREGISVFQTGIYLLVPYLLTDVASLWLVRKMRGRETLYACLGLAVIVGILPVIDKCAGLWLWQRGSFGWWLWAAAALCVIAACEWRKSMERMEELTWS